MVLLGKCPNSQRPAARNVLFSGTSLTCLKGEPQSVVSPASRQDTLAVHIMCIAVLIKELRGVWASVAVAEIISDVVEVVCASASARSRQ